MEFTDSNFETEVLESNSLVVVDFWAAWCRPCNMLTPLINRLAENYKDVKIGKINIDENADTPKKYKIAAIPTILFFKNGMIVERITGMQDESKFCDLIEKHK